MLNAPGKSFHTACVIVTWWAWLLLSGAASSQVDTGTIQGTVNDPSGRPVPGARVAIDSQDTGLTLTTQTGSEGSYIFTPLHAGRYSVSVTMSGFGKEIKNGITLDVQQSAVVDFTLAPGQVSTSVEVEAITPLLQTQDASVGQVFTTHEIDTLPLNGRNYTLLAQLTAGTTTPVAETRGLTASGSFVANGVPSIYNTYILDGITNNNNTVDLLNGAAYVVRPPVDAIQEFKVQTANYSAEFARAAGAVVNAVLKSGSNRIHGDLWEFLRNDALDAMDVACLGSDEISARAAPFFRASARRYRHSSACQCYFCEVRRQVATGSLQRAAQLFCHAATAMIAARSTN
jgi:hypothetical protein